MARVTMWADGDAIEPELLAAIVARRGGAPIDLDRVLLRSTPLATGWNMLLGQVRSHFALPMVYRELIMCRVAMLNGAEFEWNAHKPIYLSAGGSEAKCSALRLPDLSELSDLFDDREAALIDLTDQSTRNVAVDGQVIERVKRLFGDVQTVEAVATVAAYNMVSRFLVALDI